MKKVGIMGGSFDPVHLGHSELLIAADKYLGFDKIIIVPAGRQPFKLDREITDIAHRDAMIKAALEGEELWAKLDISHYETDRPDISYTINTLSHFKEKFPGKEIVFIIGGDSLLMIEKWKDAPRLLREFSFAVGMRPGSEDGDIHKKAKELRKKYATEILEIPNKKLDISSTEIRRCLGQGKTVSHMVSEEVERYIDEHGLYRKLY